MTTPEKTAPRGEDHGITTTIPHKSIVWYDAEGRLLATMAGPYDAAAIEGMRTGRPPNNPHPPGSTMLVTELSELSDGFPSISRHYVKNGKLVPRPELVPGKGDHVVVKSLNEMPDLPKGARVRVNEIDDQIMGGPGKPEIPANGPVTMQVEAFPAKETTVTIQRGQGSSEIPTPRMIYPESAKRKAPAKRKAK